MAFSAQEGKLFFSDYLIHFAKPLGFKRFLDVGCGAGRYGDLIREVFGADVQLDAVEGFIEYVPRYNLKDKYGRIFINDIRQVYDMMEDYDMIIMGDVLEHLEKEEAIEVVKGLLPKCRFLWAALPLRYSGRPWSSGYIQGEAEWQENPLNKHRHDWTDWEIEMEFSPMFLCPFVQTGVFMIEGGIR